MCANSCMSLPCITREKEALLKLKETLHDPSNRLSSWKGNHYCKWEGIGCDNVTAHVVMLDLSNPCSRLWKQEEFSCDPVHYSLKAQNLDPSLLELEYLSYLDLFGNDFHGSSIPNFIGSMRRLTYLSLSNANFGGRLPSGLRNLTNLQLLDLSGVDLGREHDLFQVLNMLPSLLRIHLGHCGLDNLNVRLVNLTNIAPRLQLLDLSQNQLTNQDLDAFKNMTCLVHLDLSININLNSVPSWFSTFRKLKYLDLSQSGLHGPIPDALRNMSSIETLKLGFNNLTTIPSWFGNFEKLVHLDLTSNAFRDPNPDPFKKKTSIEFLSLSKNKFTSIPSWLSNFEKLVHLDLSSNALYGPIPNTLQNMVFVEYLDFSFNHLTSVPCWFGEFNRLVFLDLSVNNFTLMECSLSTILTNMCRLKTLYLYGNKFGRETIGESELSGCITYALKDFDLKDNAFSGNLPTWLGKLENLEYLQLQSNFFYGIIPSFLGKLSKLKELHLNNNALDGNLHNNIGEFHSLTHLDISSNNLYGFLPSSLGELVNLQELDLSSNNFTGAIPRSLGELVNLETLDLSRNDLNGTIPRSLSQLNDLRYMYLYENNFHGNIPDDFDRLVELRRLDISSNKLDRIISDGKEWSFVMHQLQLVNLSYNHIIGSLPTNIGNVMPNLEQLLLASNMINGTIPNSLCQAELYRLDLSKNELSGEIPNCWRDTQVWEEINVSSNKLTGVFPSSVWNLSSLVWLHLNNNNLKGNFPMAANVLMDLLIFDVGENQLSGSIPSWITDAFPSLQILRLRQNNLSGSIPSQLCQLSSLKILDLSRNNFEGSIPSCLGYLRGMIQDSSSDQGNSEWNMGTFPGYQWYNEYVKQVMKGEEYDYVTILMLLVNMDLSENKLVGFIPNEITSLTGLHGLNLSHNHLEGMIPEMIDDMKSLESFDLSHNKLSGKIPNRMTSLTSLSHLNLSYNNFSGPVPIDNQFLTYEPSVYAANPYLCGHGLKNKCPGDDSGEVPRSKGHEDNDDEYGKKGIEEKMLLYSVIAVGFASGFWGVIVVLIMKKSWRYACFRWVEDATDEVYVEVVIKVAKLKKWYVRRNHVDV
ncbi:hypothetical protein TanjilG_07481 [Lupinus angustifolius]|uniref:Uncharacterized protein n=2 Tax=Lupinus angustifolius TaxID=3871 RepID=A0A4P1QV32_LUPAN|nr:hypothetical protein TanjilG_07481 [Lupinus angustifolius]